MNLKAWPSISMAITSEEKSSEEESSDNEDVVSGVSKNPILRNQNAACKGNCKKRLACCHKILFKYSLNTSALTNLFVVYEHLFDDITVHDIIAILVKGSSVLRQMLV